MRRGHPRFYELIAQIQDLHDRKNANYSEDNNPLSNFEACENIGVPAPLGCLVRMGDKWSRIQELAKGKQDLVGESMKDTLMDMAVYSLICIILLEKEENKNERDTKPKSTTGARNPKGIRASKTNHNLKR